jgi:hypothetical protein
VASNIATRLFQRKCSERRNSLVLSPLTLQWCCHDSWRLVGSLYSVTVRCSPWHKHCNLEASEMDTTTLLIILLLVLVLFGGGGWYGRRRWHGRRRY